jgi:magnesium-transporting ATPase (P-type)
VVRPDQFAVFGPVLPTDKYELVRAFQQGGQTVGTCGDGANDAPALRQAQVGIAAAVVLAVTLDLVKVPVFRHLSLTLAKNSMGWRSFEAQNKGRVNFFTVSAKPRP